MINISIKEEVFGNGKVENVDLQIPGPKITLADLILIKVKKEAENFNQDINSRKRTRQSWLRPEERILNQASLKNKQEKLKKFYRGLQVDTEKAGYDALAGFQNNAFFVIIDGEQKTDLQELLILTPETKVQFVRLTPLVGG